MAPVPFYDSSIGLLLNANKTLLDVLKKGAESPEAETLGQARLAEDMLPLVFQIQVASNTSKNVYEKLTGNSVGAWEDNEKTLAEAIARVEKTIDLLSKVDPASLDDNKTDGPVEMKYWSHGKYDVITVPAVSYLLAYAIPNFFFHVVTAYDILRHKGVKIGKGDYLANFMRATVTKAKASA